MRKILNFTLLLFSIISFAQTPGWLQTANGKIPATDANPKNLKLYEKFIRAHNDRDLNKISNMAHDSIVVELPDGGKILGKENFIPTNLKLGSAFDFIFDSSNKLSINLEFNKLLVPSPSIPILNSNNQVIGYNQADVNFLSGLFKSFGDAPDGFSEELKEITLALGLEYTYDNSFALRIGYFGENENKGARKYVTFGTGFKLEDMNLDLSYLLSTSDVISPLENTLRFSFTYNFM